MRDRCHGNETDYAARGRRGLRVGAFVFSTIFWALTTLTACGSSPEPTFFALAPTRGVTANASLHTVRIRRPGLAGYLDRPEIVRQVTDYRLGVASTERWGEPLDAMLGRVLAEDVEQRMPGVSVFTEDGAITQDPDATVEVDVRRFDVGSEGRATLWAEVAVERANHQGPAASRSVQLSAAPTSLATSSLVATLSDLLGQLADQIAALLRSS
jgi:uncharacterized lipoprotein YmbA